MCGSVPSPHVVTSNIKFNLHDEFDIRIVTLSWERKM